MRLTSQLRERVDSVLNKMHVRGLGTQQEAKALYPYATEEEDELHLKVGERVYLLGLSQPEWYVAVRASLTLSPPEIGLIPYNYVACIPEETVAPQDGHQKGSEAGPASRGAPVSFAPNPPCFLWERNNTVPSATTLSQAKTTSHTVV